MGVVVPDEDTKDDERDVKIEEASLVIEAP